MGTDATTWAELVTASRTRERPKPVALTLTRIDERGRYPNLGAMVQVDDQWVEGPEEVAAINKNREDLHKMLSERLAMTPRKEVFLFVHGYNNSFESGAFRTAQIWHFIGRGGVPVLFSSHQLAIVERLCDDVVIISKGRIAAKGSREELRQSHASDRYEIVVEQDAGWIRDVPGTTLLELDGPRAVFESAPQQVLKAALDRGEVRSFTPVVPTLDEIFKEVI